MEFITLAEAQKRLGTDVFIMLESEGSCEKKTAAGKQDEIWGFSLLFGRLRRPDGKFHEAGVFLHPAGYEVLAINEEPTAPPGVPIGHIIVDVNEHGFVRTRTNKGLSGEILELKPSSLSKGDLAASGRVPDGLPQQANPQRIIGAMGAYLNVCDFPDTEGMSPEQFRVTSADGRSHSALAAVGLYVGKPGTTD